MAANLNFALGQNANESPAGSDGSAASGRGSDLSEWLRSVSDAGVRAKENTGHRNRNHRHRQVALYDFLHKIRFCCHPIYKGV
jgi:hypothetical protein